MNDEEWTCGKGLAASAVLPEKLAAVLAAMADNLDLHTGALGADDATTRAELDVYRRLVEEQRRAVAQLEALSPGDEDSCDRCCVALGLRPPAWVWLFQTPRAGSHSSLRSEPSIEELEPAQGVCGVSLSRTWEAAPRRLHRQASPSAFGSDIVVAVFLA